MSKISSRSLRRPIRNKLVTVEPRSKVKDAVVAIEAGRAIGFDVVPIARKE